MFQFFSILLLSIAALQIVEAIKIWVKPSNLRYNAEISCLHRNLPITIGTAKHGSSFFEEYSTAGYVDIGTDLSRCDDHHNSTVKVRITTLDDPSDSKEFEIPKAELSARRSAVVLAFNIEPRAYKIFYFQQSSSNPLVDYELEIACEYHQPSGSSTQYYLIGSGAQLNGQNYINIPIYEIEMMAYCEEGRIWLAIHNAENARTTFINVTRKFLRQNDAFNINMSNEIVQPIHNDALLLLAPVLHIVEAIKIWVKPSNLRYNAEISCLRHYLRITIGQAKHESAFFEEYSTAGYVDIGTDLSRCDDHHNSTVKVRITTLDDPSDSSIFEIPKAELSARRSVVVLAFNIEPRANKIFYFQQSSSNPLMDYELQIECKYRLADGALTHYLIGSGIQLNGQNGINIPIYEIEMLAFCKRGKIGLEIYIARREKTHINVTREFLLENDAFNIDMSNETVRPISQGRNDPLLSTRTIVSSSRIPSGASSSTTGQTESSTMATAQTLRPFPQTESNYKCVVCCVIQDRPEIALLPCGHICACRGCSEEIIKKECPKCGQKIEELLRIYL